MPTAWKRDLEADGRKFEEWLRKRRPDASDLRMSPLVSPTSSGFSNETLLFDLTYESSGERVEEKLVVRIQPIGFPVFPEYDMNLQFETMRALEATDVPVPRMRWIEHDDLEIFGAPFYVMDQVAGRVPTDNPPYHLAGWMTEIPPAERTAIWWGGIDSLAAISRLDPEQLGLLPLLDRRAPGQSALDASLAYYQDYFEMAARGRAQPTVEAAFEWLLANKPAHQRTGLVWGDARIGNIIYDGTTPAAVVDWEMATLGDPEEDLGWFFFLDRHHSEGLERPRLEGFPSYEETVAGYEERTGRPVEHLHYYQVWAGVRFGCVMVRLAQQMVHYEQMPEEAGLEFEINNTVTRLLAKILELPPPGAKQGEGFSG